MFTFTFGQSFNTNEVAYSLHFLLKTLLSQTSKVNSGHSTWQSNRIDTLNRNAISFCLIHFATRMNLRLFFEKKRVQQREVLNADCEVLKVAGESLSITNEVNHLLLLFNSRFAIIATVDY